VGIVLARLDEDGSIHFLGQCVRCNQIIQYDLLTLLALLYNPAEEKGN